MDDLLTRWRGNFLVTEGRVPARDWRIGMIALFALSLAGQRLISAGLGGALAGQSAKLIWFAALLYPFICLSAQRFADRGKPGWLALACALPAALNMLINLAPPFPGSLAIGAALGGAALVSFVWFVIELGFAGSRLNLQAA